MEENNSQIGERLKFALAELKISNKEISEIFDTSSQNISNLKNSNKMNDLMSRIAVHYGININWILTGKGYFLVDLPQTHNFQNSKNKLKNGSSLIDNSVGKTNPANSDEEDEVRYKNIPVELLSELDILFKRDEVDKEVKKDFINKFEDFIYELKKTLRK